MGNIKEFLFRLFCRAISRTESHSFHFFSASSRTFLIHLLIYSWRKHLYNAPYVQGTRLATCLISINIWITRQVTIMLRNNHFHSTEQSWKMNLPFTKPTAIFSYLLYYYNGDSGQTALQDYESSTAIE